MWILVILFAVFSFATARILQKKLLTDKNQDAITYAIFLQLIVSLIILPVALLNHFTFPPLENLWGNFVLMILLYTSANIFAYRAIMRIPISDFMIINATAPLWTAITSIPLLGESASVIKVAGIIFTVLGIIVVFYQKKLKLQIGHLYALLTALSFGFAFTNDAFLLRSFNATTYSFIYFAAPAIFMACLYPGKLKKVSYLVNKKNKNYFFLSTLCLALSSLAINTAFKLGGEISQISALLQLTIIVTVLFGILFLKERTDTQKKIIGTIVVVLGAILVGLK